MRAIGPGAAGVAARQDPGRRLPQPCFQIWSGIAVAAVLGTGTTHSPTLGRHRQLASVVIRTVIGQVIVCRYGFPTI